MLVVDGGRFENLLESKKKLHVRSLNGLAGVLCIVRRPLGDPKGLASRNSRELYLTAAVVKGGW